MEPSRFRIRQTQQLITGQAGLVLAGQALARFAQLPQQLNPKFPVRATALPTRRIEIDGAYLGGERSGKRGRGAAAKFPFVVAVQTSDEGRPQRLQLRRVRGFTRAEIERYARTSITPGSHIVSDGLHCFGAFDNPLYTHKRIVTGSGRASAQIPAFNWVNTVLGNVKNAITGSLHAIRGKHAPRYLAEFEYRFNRRFNLPAMIERFAYVALRTPPMPYRLLKMAELYT